MNDWQRVRGELTQTGVAGAQDLGRFVSNVEFFRPSELDEREAMPVLMRVLPTVSDAKLIEAIAGHLRRPWARPAAFDALHDAYRIWAVRESSAGWALGDAMANAARAEHLPVLLDVVSTPEYGTSRQMVVDALSRFKKSPDVAPALLALLIDSDVALHAMSALRRTIGATAALPYLREVHARYEKQPLGHTALREIQKAERAIGRRPL